jgi:hypothetical protein
VAGAGLAIIATIHPGGSLNLLNIGDFLDHPAFDCLDRHRRDATAAARATELDRHLTGVAVDLLDGGAPAVHLNLWEVLPEEIRDMLAEIVVARLVPASAAMLMIHGTWPSV